MLGISISYWDLLKFLYFTDTTGRGDRGWKEAQRQGEVRVTLRLTLLSNGFFPLQKDNSMSAALPYSFLGWNDFICDFTQCKLYIERSAMIRRFLFSSEVLKLEAQVDCNTGCSNLQCILHPTTKWGRNREETLYIYKIKDRNPSTISTRHVEANVNTQEKIKTIKIVAKKKKI
jgi:hypothetical protein